MKYPYRLLVLFFLAIWPLLGLAELPARMQIGEDMRWHEDRLNQAPTLDALMELEHDLSWHDTDGLGVSRGFVSTPHWFHFRLPAVASPQDVDRYLHLPDPLLNRIEVFVLWDGEKRQSEILGTDFPFEHRPLRHREFVMPVSLNPDGATDIYLRIQTNGSLQVEPLLWAPDALVENTRLQGIASGLFFGIMLVMFFYNLFIYFVVRDRSYLYYIGFVAAFTLFMLALQGDGYQFLWPNAVAWNETSVAFSVALLGLVTLPFTRSFLKLKKNWPRADQVLNGMWLVSLVLVVLSFLLAYEVSIRINALHGILIMVSVLTIGIVMWLQGFRHARYFVLAWVALLVGTSALALSKFGVLPWNVVTANGAQIGAVLEVVLLSFALGDRINQERAARFEAQKQALDAAEQARSAQDELLEAKETANKELEARVKERTRELEQTLEKLETVNRFLEEVSNTDQLTGLSNRHCFVRRYHEEYKRAQRHQYPVSIVLMDIDHFKSFNDNYGHIAGDECLKAVSGALSRIITRAGDVVARFGGEEFIALLTATDLNGAEVVGERLRQAVAELTIQFEDEVIPVTISVGVADEVPQNLTNPEQLIQNADDALYAAKEGGRNRVCRYPHDVSGGG